MAVYSTVAKAAELYGEDIVATVCSRDGDGAADLESFEKHLRIGDRTINAYLLGKYSLPLATPPENFEKLCVDIAFYNATTHTPGRRTKGMETAYKEAIDYLTLIATNKIKLEVETDVTVANKTQTAVTQTRSTVATITGTERYWKRDTVKGLL